jgi:hypothetical protein
MSRTFQMMSSGAGDIAIGTVLAYDPRNSLAAQQYQRNYPIAICMCGSTAQRPQGGDGDVVSNQGQPQAGILFLDTSLGFIVVSDGAGGWRNPATGSAV